MMREVEVKADPKRPYKLYAAIVGTFMGTLLTNEIISGNPWAVAFGGALVSGLAVFIKGNPIITVPKQQPNAGGRDKALRH